MTTDAIHSFVHSFIQCATWRYLALPGATRRYPALPGATWRSHHYWFIQSKKLEDGDTLDVQGEVSEEDEALDPDWRKLDRKVNPLRS